MKKLNNKGFTLIEMLVVIAIIAVLVAIIIPVVANSTTKAAAATDAANMRSFKAEIVTSYLQNGAGAKDADGKALTIKSTGESVNVTIDSNKISYPAMKSFTLGNTAVPSAVANDTTNWKITFNTEKQEFTVKYYNKLISDYATVAETGEWPAAT